MKGAYWPESLNSGPKLCSGEQREIKKEKRRKEAAIRGIFGRSELHY